VVVFDEGKVITTKERVEFYFTTMPYFSTSAWAGQTGCSAASVLGSIPDPRRQNILYRSLFTLESIYSR
jgi:hypothetical protein